MLGVTSRGYRSSPGAVSCRSSGRRTGGGCSGRLRLRLWRGPDGRGQTRGVVFGAPVSGSDGSAVIDEVEDFLLHGFDR